ncbi:hypothetical protein [Desulfurobacterium sp.]
MDKEFSEYANEIVKYISETFPGLHFRGNNDLKIIKEWYYLAIPEKFIMKFVTEMEENPPSSFEELGKKVIEMYKVEKSRERKQIKMDMHNTNLSPGEKLKCLYNILQDVLLSISVDNVFILEKLKEISELDDELIEEQLEEFEDVFFSYLLNHVPDRERLKRDAAARLEKYRFYWDEKIYKITYRALIKKILRERYEIPEFTIAIVD